MVTECLDLLAKNGIDLGPDTTRHNLVERLGTALRALKSYREKVQREREAAERERDRNRDEAAERDAKRAKGPTSHDCWPKGSMIAMSAEPPKLNITQADLDPIQQRAGIVQDVSYVQPGQDNLEVRREDFASGKIPPELYEYSPTEQHLISEWALFSAGLRATPPEQPRPTAKPKLVIKDTPQAKKSDKAAEANGDALLSRIQAPRDKWRRTV